MVEVTGAGEIVNKGGSIQTGGSENVGNTGSQASTGADQVNLHAEDGVRQDWWPEGVNTEDELKAYVEGLNKPQDGAIEGEPAKGEPDPQNAPKLPEGFTPDTRTDDEIKAALAEAGGLYADERYAPLAIEMARSGQLTDASVTAAATAFGVPENAVRDFIKGQQALQAQGTTKAASEATAQQQAMATAIVKVVTENADYEAIVGTWGKDNLSDPEKKAFDSALDRGDAATVESLLKGFYDRYKLDGHGAARREITTAGTGGAATQGQPAAVEPYGSLGEYTKDSSTKRYREDAKFRDQVDKRFIASDFSKGR